MTDCTEHRRERALWLAEHILPLEPWLRQWLRHGWPGIETETDDLVQECYARLLQAASIDHVVNARHYLSRTARSILIDRHRRSLIVQFEHVPDPDIFGVAADQVPQDEAYDARCRLVRVSAAVDRLSPQRREVLLLRRMDELPLRATAERIGVSETVVSTHLRNALVELRAAANCDQAMQGA